MTATDTVFVDYDLSAANRVVADWLNYVGNTSFRGNLGMAGYEVLSKRPMTTIAADRPSVLDYARGVNIRTGVNDALDSFNRAIAANPGVDIFVPRGIYLNSGPIVLGGDGATELVYNGLVGEGWPNFIGTAAVSPSILKWTSGQGLQFNNAYCSLQGLTLWGVQAGGSDPTTSTFGNVGVSLSGAEWDGGSSLLQWLTVYGWDTGFKTQNASNDSFGGAYFSILFPYVINCVNGWALTQATTDLRVFGGKTTDCTNFGVYSGVSTYRGHSFVGHLFELCGTTAPNRARVAVRADANSKVILSNTYLEAANLCAGKTGVIEVDTAHHINSSTQVFGPGVILLHDSFGEAIDLGLAVDVNSASWTKTQCTATLADDATNPRCYRIQSSAAAATVVSLEALVTLTQSMLNPEFIKVNGSVDVKHFLSCVFRIKWASTGPSAWTANGGFLPVIQMLDWNGTSDAFDVTTNTDSALWTLTDNDWWTVNLQFPLRWNTAYLASTLKTARVFIAFSGAAGPAYNVSNLDAYLKIGRLTFHQQAIP